MRQAFLVKAGDLCKLVEAELDKGNKLETPEQWNEFIFRIFQEGKIEHLAELPDDMDGELLSANLREEGINARTLKIEKKDDSPSSQNDSTP